MRKRFCFSDSVKPDTQAAIGLTLLIAAISVPLNLVFGIAAAWAVTEKASVTLGINNVLDDNPSVSGSVGTTGNGNTFPQTYDALGRYVFLRASVEF